MLNRLFGSRYRISEKIGIGGMAEVYKATDEVLGRTVAVKVMLPQYAADPTFAVRFKQEAQAAANLQSPYIVNIYDWGHDATDNTYYIVMEYVRGTDLKTAINLRGKINQRKVAEIGSQVCAALGVAHSYDIIHRDIKPHNIMVQPDGNAKVMDFGIARAGNTQMTQTGSVLGTAYYVSPEQAQGKPLTAATDIYSLGVVLYEAVCGTVPFDGSDPVSIAVKQVNERPRPPRAIDAEIDPALEAIILKAMAKNPSERFTTAEQMRSALNDYLAGRASNFVDPSARTAMMAGGRLGAGTNRPYPAASFDEYGGSIPAREQTDVMPPIARPRANNAAQGARPIDTGTNSKRSHAPAIVVGILAAILVIVAAVAVALNFMKPTTELITVPSVLKMSEADASRTITGSNLVVGEVKSEPSETVPEGQVVRQDPAASSKVEKDSKVNLWLSTGTNKVAVPDLRNMTTADAETLLDGLGLTYGFGQNKPDANIESGKICGQNPAAGQKVERGTKIVYDLSSGPDSEDIPYVIGLAKEDAEYKLRSAGFEVAYAEDVFSTSYAVGAVAAQDKTGTAKKGETITLTVSKGPEPEETPQVKVPNVVGMNMPNASNQMFLAGLMLDYDYPPDAEEVVLTQNPIAGTMVDKGSPVSVTFGSSSGSSSSSSGSGGSGGSGGGASTNNSNNNNNNSTLTP